MNKIILLALASGAAVSTAAMTSSAWAASAGNVAVSPDGRTVIVTPGPNVQPTHFQRATGTVIFSNFATLDPLGVYAAGFGSGFGYNSTQYPYVELAAAFTAGTSSAVTEIDVAAGYLSGAKTEVQVHLYQDAGGAPGTELWTHSTDLPPDQGSCCGVTQLMLKTGGVRLIAGQQYWLSLGSTKGAPGTFGAWYLNVADQVDVGQTAINLNNGAGWTVSPQLPLPAFAVFGK